MRLRERRSMFYFRSSFPDIDHQREILFVSTAHQPFDIFQRPNVDLEILHISLQFVNTNWMINLHFDKFIMKAMLIQLSDCGPSLKHIDSVYWVILSSTFIFTQRKADIPHCSSVTSQNLRKVMKKENMNEELCKNILLCCLLFQTTRVEDPTFTWGWVRSWDTACLLREVRPLPLQTGLRDWTTLVAGSLSMNTKSRQNEIACSHELFLKGSFWRTPKKARGRGHSNVREINDVPFDTCFWCNWVL